MRGGRLLGAGGAMAGGSAPSSGHPNCWEGPKENAQVPVTGSVGRSRHALSAAPLSLCRGQTRAGQVRPTPREARAHGVVSPQGPPWVCQGAAGWQLSPFQTTLTGVFRDSAMPVRMESAWVPDLENGLVLQPVGGCSWQGSIPPTQQWAGVALAGFRFAWMSQQCPPERCLHVARGVGQAEPCDQWAAKAELAAVP